mmetsp:Transcript_44344/g.95524  ORF Transcript_44344/g.95524 Transcript_44344/m.95524 type:complete len:280 (+) Transcript_44344:412-1251(+)
MSFHVASRRTTQDPRRRSRSSRRSHPRGHARHTLWSRRPATWIGMSTRTLIGWIHAWHGIWHTWWRLSRPRHSRRAIWWHPIARRRPAVAMTTWTARPTRATGPVGPARPAGPTGPTGPTWRIRSTRTARPTRTTRAARATRTRAPTRRPRRWPMGRAFAEVRRIGASLSELSLHHHHGSSHDVGCESAFPIATIIFATLASFATTLATFTVTAVSFPSTATTTATSSSVSIAISTTIPIMALAALRFRCANEIARPIVLQAVYASQLAVAGALHPLVR